MQQDYDGNEFIVRAAITKSKYVKLAFLWVLKWIFPFWIPVRWWALMTFHNHSQLLSYVFTSHQSAAINWGCTFICEHNTCYSYYSHGNTEKRSYLSEQDELKILFYYLYSTIYCFIFLYTIDSLFRTCLHTHIVSGDVIHSAWMYGSITRNIPETNVRH